MTEPGFFSLTHPGQVFQASAAPAAQGAPGGPGLAVITQGGQVHIAGAVGTAGPWRHLELPSATDAVSSVAWVVTDPPGTLAPLVVGEPDGKVWVLSTDPSSPGWTDLGSPGQPLDALTAVTVRRPAGLRHVLVTIDRSRRPWMREGLDPDGTWFPLPTGTGWEIEEVALATAATTPGRQPEVHLFAVVSGPETHGREVRVAVRENSVWTWIDPGQRPDGAQSAGLGATTTQDAAGAVQACAVVGSSASAPDFADTVCMLTGAARSWRWVDLGVPPGGNGLRTAVVGRGDPAGGDPVVVVRTGHHLWWRSPGTDWQDLGTTPGDRAVADPVDCLELAGAGPRRFRTVGVSWDGELWTVDVDGADVRWVDHGVPTPLAGVAGVYTDPEDPDVLGLLSHVFVVDAEGLLWESRLGGTQVDVWDPHGRPSPAIACRAGIGAVPEDLGQPPSVFLLGTDDRLWARVNGPGGGAWTDHGAPAGRRITAALPPVVDALLPGSPHVAVVADDGQLSLRGTGAAGPEWTLRGAPPGQRIFALVGTGVLPAAPGPRLVTGIAAEDGHVWLDVPGGAVPWVDLGSPAVGERVAAGLGAQVLTGPGGAPVLHLVVVTTPGGHAWTRTFTLVGGVGGWTDLGRPGDTRIEGGLGVIADPLDATTARVFVLADRKKLWTRDVVGQDPGWTLWGLPFRTDELAGGRASVLGSRTAVLVIDADADHRLWLATTEEF